MEQPKPFFDPNRDDPDTWEPVKIPFVIDNIENIDNRFDTVCVNYNGRELTFGDIGYYITIFLMEDPNDPLDGTLLQLVLTAYNNGNGVWRVDIGEQIDWFSPRYTMAELYYGDNEWYSFPMLVDRFPIMMDRLVSNIP